MVPFSDSIPTITFDFGYAFDRISTTLSNFEVSDSKTCFVLFSQNLIDNVDDFANIYGAVRDSLPNPIICYIGDDSNIPSELVNKVVHSDAIVTDLNTGETMPLVIKYIRYAQRLLNLFNG